MSGLGSVIRLGHQENPFILAQTRSPGTRPPLTLAVDFNDGVFDVEVVERLFGAKVMFVATVAAADAVGETDIAVVVVSEVVFDITVVVVSDVVSDVVLEVSDVVLEVSDIVLVVSDVKVVVSDIVAGLDVVAETTSDAGSIRCSESWSTLEFVSEMKTSFPFLHSDVIVAAIFQSIFRPISV